MRTPALVIIGVIAATGAARAAAAPLLVAVEIAPGMDVSPADLRRTIATELGVPVTAAQDPGAAEASDILLVTVEPHEVRMSLRAVTTPVVARTISAPADRTTRLRSIGWLAGNLVRDQVGPVVAPAAPAPAVSPIVGTPPPTEPPPMPVATAASDPAAPAAVLASRSTAREEAVPHARWSITAGGGPTLNAIYLGGGDTYFSRGTLYQIEVRHQSSPDSLLIGAAVAVGPDYQPSRHYFGADAFVGSDWSRRSWFLEGDLGLGFEALDGRNKTITVTNDSSMPGTSSTTTVSIEPLPGIYLRAAGIAGVRVFAAFDLVAQLGAHLSSSGEWGSFASSTIGVRLRLP